MENVNKTINDIIDKAYEEGITRKEIKILKEIRDDFIEEPSDINNLCYEIINIIYSQGFFNKYTKEDIDYIINKSLLLPLVLANNNSSEMRVTENSVYFLCQFHREKTSSMRVKTSKNSEHGHCFGCGCNFLSNSYLIDYENINFKESIELLSSIFLFNIKNKYKDEELVEKYKNSLLGNEYKQILDKQLELKKINDSDLMLDNYNYRLKTIERVKNNEYDENFIYHELPKKRKLNLLKYKIYT